MTPRVRFLIVWIALLTQTGGAGIARADREGAKLLIEAGKDQDRGWVTVRVELVDAFDEDIRQSLRSGLPTTVRFSTELWQHRSRWFDRQVDSRVTTFRIQWDPGERVFWLTYPGPRPRDSYEELIPLLAKLSQRTIRVHSLGKLEARHRYFVTVEAAIRPLTLEEFRELDGWISGRIRGRGDAEAGGVTDTTGVEGAAESPSSGGGGGGVTGAFFGLLVDLAGFGDTIYRARTEPFGPSDLRAVPLED